MLSVMISPKEEFGATICLEKHSTFYSYYVNHGNMQSLRNCHFYKFIFIYIVIYMEREEGNMERKEMNY